MINKSGFLVSKDNRKIDKNLMAKRLLTSLTPIDFMTDEELIAVSPGSDFVFDVECYTNFFYVAFKCLSNGKFVAFEQSADHSINTDKMLWVMWRFCIVGFNSKNYDLPMLALATKGATCEQLKQASDFIIQGENKPWDFQREYEVKIENFNHIDLIEVAPLQGSLKLYSGRLHCKRMQDLPFEHDTVLTSEDAQIIRPYCCNDLENTELLYNDLALQLQLRSDMTKEYGIDLRSKSDAQIAEAVVSSELEKILGCKPKRPKFEEGGSVKYKAPGFIKFESPHLNRIVSDIENSIFVLDKRGAPCWPANLGQREKTATGYKTVLTVTIGKKNYKLGMGGLHSKDNSEAHIASDDTWITEDDVASFYPYLIINQGLFPPHLGEAFLAVYEKIVETRITAKGDAKKAKKQGDRKAAKIWKSIADSLKIVINGLFGKFGNKYSIVYAPDLMLQVTITGQLVLLMLIEMLENIGIEVISGNTDGVISKYDKSRQQDKRQVIENLEKITNLSLEETRYAATYNRDVNNYIAIKDKEGDSEARYLDDQLGCKTKGTYCERGSALNSVLSKNPESLICSDAVISYLKNGTSVEKTIKESKDIRRFVNVRNVKGGGEKNGIYLGKVVRWYYVEGEQGFIAYVGSGNKVANSDGAKPLMDLPDELPDDIDYKYYITKSIDMLYDLGALNVPTTQSINFF